MKTAIITGSLGLVGSHVAQVLSHSGFRVVGIDCDVRSTLFPDVSELSFDDIQFLYNQSSIDVHYSIDFRDYDQLS